MVDFTRPPLPLGKIMITRAAAQLLIESYEQAMPFLIRHSAWDWGNCSRENWAANDAGATSGEPVTSRYVLATGEAIYVATEGDRSRTVILAESEV